MPGFNLASYTDVNSRMKLARDTWQSITVHDPVMLTETFGYIKATVMLRDGRTVTEAAEFRLDLTTRSAQSTNPIGDAATSAIGRALGRFGFGTDAHFPSREEMEQIPEDRLSPVEAAAKQADARVSLRDELRTLRQELAATGGKPSNLRSSEVMAMTEARLREEIAFTRDEIESTRAQHPASFIEVERAA